MNSQPGTRTSDGDARRSYESPLRKQQADRTREIILEALAEQMGDPDVTDFSIPDVAKRAGVSTRTVYRNFPTRDVLIDALSDFINVRIGRPSYPKTADEIAESAEQLFPLFDANAHLMEAQVKTATGRSVRGAARKKRVHAVRKALEEVSAGLDEGEATGAAAVIKVLLSADAWRAMRRDFGLDGASSGKAAAWAIRTLVADLRRRSKKNQKP